MNDVQIANWLNDNGSKAFQEETPSGETTMFIQLQRKEQED